MEDFYNNMGNYDDEYDQYDNSTDTTEWGNFQNTLGHHVANAISLYVFPLLIVLGSLGNVFCVMVLHRLSKKVWSTCLYLAVISVTDILVLYVRCGNDWMRALIGTDVSTVVLVKSEAICKVYPFAYNFLVHLSKWLLVAMTVECVLSVRYPWRVEQMCTVERARAVILLLTVLLVCVNIHYFWSFRLQNPSEKKTLHSGGSLTCNFDEHGSQHSEEFQRIIWPLLEGLFTEIIPYIIVGCGCSVVLFSCIRGTHLGPAGYQAWQRKYLLDPDTLTHLKITIAVLGILYVLLTCPKFVFLVIRFLVENDHISVEYVVWEKYFNPVHTWTNTLEYVYHSAKVLLYLSSCRHFRDNFKQVFLCCKPRNKTFGISPRHSRNNSYVDSGREQLVQTYRGKQLTNNIHVGVGSTAEEIYMPDITTV